MLLARWFHDKANNSSRSTLLFDRPEGEHPDGLEREARDQCTGERSQVTDMLPSGPTAAHGSGLRRSRLAEEWQRWHPGKKLLGWSLPLALRAICSEPFPYQALLEPARTSGEMAEEGDSLTTKAGGPRLSRFHLIPHHYPSPSRHGTPAEAKRTQWDGWGAGKFWELINSLFSQKDGLFRD